MARVLHDFYFKEAKREGYRSRAAYKLIEIDDRRRILRPGDRVLDCGAAPGSWMQVAGARVGRKGVVVGIDLQAFTRFDSPGDFVILRGDALETDDATLLGAAGDDRRRFDVVLSDMAPPTTGEAAMDHHRSARLVAALLDRCSTLLRPGGHFVAKVFEGETYPDLLARTGDAFDAVKGFKPKASRAISREMFIVAKGFRAREVPQAPRPAAERPKRGW